MVTGYKLMFAVGRNVTKTGIFKNVTTAGLLFLFHDRLSLETNSDFQIAQYSLIQTYFDYCSVVWAGPGVRTGSEASRNSKTSYDYKFSAGYISSTAPALQKLGWDRCSKHPVDIHNGGLYKYILFVWYLAFLNSFESKCFFVFCTCFNMCKVRKDNNIHIKHYINKPPL